MTEVVETIVADTMADLCALRDRGTRADLLELRLDGVRDVDVAGAITGRPCPVIVTCRAAWEGGRFDGSEEERQRLLVQAAKLGAEFVDVEWRADRQLFDQCRASTRVVVSHHDFAGTPSDLRDRVDAMRRVGADVVKIAVQADTILDCLRLQDAVVSERGTDHVAIAMGPAGQLTRLWPAWIGSRWTYGGTAAPGQVSVAALIDQYRVRRTTTATTAYGVTGSPLGHSASPAMHNAACAALDLDAVYLPLEARDATEFFAVAEAMALAGASVTIPMKQALLTSAVDADDLSRRIGALNTLRRGANGWEGRNFDVAGFLAPLEERSIPLRDRRVVVLGAGGSARAAVWALTSHGARVELSARRPEAAQSLAGELGVRTSSWPPEPGWDLLVNTTPVGMWPHVDASPIPVDLDEGVMRHARGKVVYDLVYNPARTKLIALAERAGATTIGGLEMLVSQACRQFEWWTGRTAPRAVMDAAATAFLGQCAG